MVFSGEKESANQCKEICLIFACLHIGLYFPDVLTSGKLLSMPMMSGDIYCLVWKSDADWKLC